MRILMLGNSLTRANGLPELLGERLGAEVVVHARGGARLAEHLNPATRLGALTQEALSHGGIDFVAMQEMSNAPVKTPERFYEAVERLAAQVRASLDMEAVYRICGLPGFRAVRERPEKQK